jgi:hypothetical protein
MTDVAGNQEATTALALDQALGFLGVLMLIEIHDGGVGAFLCVSDRHGPPDSAVAACDQRHFIP